MSLHCGMYWLGMTIKPDVAILWNCCLDKSSVPFILDALAVSEGCGLIADG